MEKLAGRTLAMNVAPEIIAMADHVLEQHSEVLAVLAYGSCLRGVATTESLIDLYVLTETLNGVSGNALLRTGCRLVPPNVHFAECEFEGRIYRAKYAVLPRALFAAWMTSDNPYFWARFSQPAALVWTSDAISRAIVGKACAQAAETMFANARALTDATDPLDIWTAGFAETYATELRAETASRARSVVEANADYYREAAKLLAHVEPKPALWGLRRFKGKLWSVVRLIKAAFTFTGGADYIAWKIERHSGQKVELSDWQKRHPVIASVTLLPKLLKSGAVR